MNVDDMTVTEEQIGSMAKLLKNLELADILQLILLILVLIVLVQVLSRLLTRIIQRSKLDKSMHGFLRQIIRAALYCIAAMIVASSIGLDVTSLIALLSVAALAVSLALQGALSNLASGIVILATKPFRVGDYVSVDGKEGFVEEITMTYTRLSTYEKQKIFIPNGTVTTVSVVNYTMDGRRRIDHEISASYDCDLDQVKAALRDAVKAVPEVLSDPPAEVLLTGFGESAITYVVRVWTLNETYWPCYFGVLEQVKRSFERSGVEMTYPHLNVHLEQQ